MSERIKILFVSDAISTNTGLARIHRDLVTRTHEHLSDVYEVATAGQGGSNSRHFKMPQYNFETKEDWIIPNLLEIWRDFAGDERGIIFTIWDVSRLGWLAQPVISPALKSYPSLQRWLTKRPFELWAYTAIDGSGPNDRLSFPLMRTALGCDRLLAYGPFGEGVLRRTLAPEDCEKRHLTNLPHGVDTNVFFSTEKSLCRAMFMQITGAEVYSKDCVSIYDDEILVGICATNQDRKQWSLGIEACAIMAREKKIKLWIHTDTDERYWSIPALLVDHGLLDKAFISLGQISDERMAEAYSACDLMFGIGPEGFGLPNAEALACNVPVITGSYAGSGDFVPETMQVSPVAFHYQGSFGTMRPVYSAREWARVALTNLNLGATASLNPQYEWNNLWPRWESWFRQAAEEFKR